MHMLEDTILQKAITMVHNNGKKDIFVDHCNDAAWCEYVRLVIILILHKKYSLDFLLQQDVTHACLEAVRPTTIDIPHT